MNEQEAIEKTRVQWTELAETGAMEKPELKDVDCDCYLCQYSYEITDCTGAPEKCRPCPYHKKYGQCFGSESQHGQAPYSLWWNSKTQSNKRKHAKAFVEQVKALRSPEMDKKEIERRINKYELVRECAEENLNDLNKQLAEAEKLKPLEHGDYGPSERGSGSIEIVLWNTIEGFDRSKPCGEKRNYNHVGMLKEKEITPIGNIFDDFAAMSEPLKEFYVDGFHVSIQGKRILFGGKYLSIENATDLYRGTGRVIATLLEQQAK